MSIVILVGCILLLLVLVTFARLNAFLALSITALTVGLLKGMPLPKLIESVQKGVGSTIGGLLLVIGFGVMLGSLMAETGAAQRIANQLIRFFGTARAKYAVALTGFIVGLAMFYNAGFVVLMPLVFAVSISTGLPLVYLGLAMASALSVTHGFLPPHPGPTAIVQIFKADAGKTLLLGLVVALPTLFVAGILFTETTRKIVANPPKGLFEIKDFAEKDLPSYPLSMAVALMPVLLMAVASVCDLTLPEGHFWRVVFKFLGDPNISMLLAVLFAIVTLVILRGERATWRPRLQASMDKATTALNAATMIILITAAGGAFKQVLQDAQIGDDITAFFKTLPLSPLVLGWLVATIIRVTIGSATIAGLTAAGIVQPLVATSGVSPELMVLSVGAGSLMCSHVNDTGFWMYKEYFGVSLKDTFRSWTLMETIVGVMGLLIVLVLDVFI